MEPRSVDYQDYVKIYQKKHGETFQLLVSTEAKLVVATEYASELQAKIVELQAENESLQSQLNKKAGAPKRKVEPAKNDSYQDASGV
jgi:uncharacterized small protein (DUF1192 family)